MREWPVIMKCGLASYSCRRNVSTASVNVLFFPPQRVGETKEEPDLVGQGEALLSPRVGDRVIPARPPAAAERVFTEECQS